MDTITHALSGALLARATAPRTPQPDDMPLGRRVLLGGLAAAFPDADIIASLLSPLSYLYHHRGVTHSVLMLPLWTVLLAFLCTLIWRGGPRWRAYAGVMAGGLAIHIAGDWITSFGTMLLAPLSDRRFALSTTFIIDLWFSGIIALGLLASLVWRRTRVPATVGLLVLAGYVVFQYGLQQQAIALGVAHAQREGLGDARVSAMPRPVSPFNWMVVIEDGTRYRYALINLKRKQIRHEGAGGWFAALDAPYRPVHMMQWLERPMFGDASREPLAREAYASPAFAFFRWFSRYPLLHAVDERAGCAWFHDLRFWTPGRGSWPFRYGVCRDGNGGWQAFNVDERGNRSAVH